MLIESHKLVRFLLDQCEILKMIRLEMGKPTTTRVTYEDAKFYLFCLADGWRFPTLDECLLYEMYSDWWYVDRDWLYVDRKQWYNPDDVYFLQPVREVPDDD